MHYEEEFTDFPHNHPWRDYYYMIVLATSTNASCVL
jgi:hypothetical protein